MQMQLTNVFYVDVMHEIRLEKLWQLSISEHWPINKHGHCFQKMEISKSGKIIC